MSLKQKLNINDPCPSIDLLVQEYARLKEGYDLLLALWFNGDDIIVPIELKIKIDNFFGIDDSE